jgi:hypothetical protein
VSDTLVWLIVYSSQHNILFKFVTLASHKTSDKKLPQIQVFYQYITLCEKKKNSTISKIIKSQNYQTILFTRALDGNHSVNILVEIP